MGTKKNILVFRFSALGDVLLAVPILFSALDKNENLVITFVTKEAAAKFLPKHERLNVVPVDFNQYKGFIGLRKLAKSLSKKTDFDALIDLHDVLRTKVLRSFFSKAKVVVFEKGRKDKKKAVKLKIKSPLKHVSKRYAEAFNQAGIKAERAKRDLYSFDPAQSPQKINSLKGAVGFAPFSNHASKNWPKENCRLFIELLVEKDLKVVLFGGPNNKTDLQELAKDFSNVEVLAGNLTNQEELELISTLSCMVSMDSFNMHLANLLKTPTLSIWGGTSPLLGFNPIGENNTLITPKEKLDCMPCSVYGTSTCKRGDWACLTTTTPQQVVKEVNRILNR